MFQGKRQLPSLVTTDTRPGSRGLSIARREGVRLVYWTASPNSDWRTVPLSEPQKQKLRDWLRSKGVHPVCASCGARDWGAGELVSVPILDHDGAHRSDSHVPMVQLVCTNCSYLMLYAAVPIGLP